MACYARSAFLQGLLGLVALGGIASGVVGQERTLWKPVHKSAFREVSTTIISPTSSEIVGPKSASSGVIFSTPTFVDPGSTVESSFLEAPSGAIETTSDEFDYWLVDARSAPVEGDLRCGVAKLRFWHYVAGHWTEYSKENFIAAMDPSLPTMFFVHGYGLGAPAAAFSTARYAHHISRCSRKFRIVTWAWGSRHSWLDTPWENVQDKSWKSEVQGYYLAHMLGRLCPDTQIALVGHSFGCRAICASLQGLATGSICRVPLEERATFLNYPYEATLIAAGIESNALAPGNRYGMALSQVQRMNITTNSHDRVLRLLRLVTANPDIMGLEGPDCSSLPPDEAMKIKVHDMGLLVLASHRMGRYTWSNATIPAIQPRILGDLVHYGTKEDRQGAVWPLFFRGLPYTE